MSFRSHRNVFWALVSHDGRLYFAQGNIHVIFFNFDFFRFCTKTVFSDSEQWHHPRLVGEEAARNQVKTLPQMKEHLFYIILPFLYQIPLRGIAGGVPPHGGRENAGRAEEHGGSYQNEVKHKQCSLLVLGIHQPARKGRAVFRSSNMFFYIIETFLLFLENLNSQDQSGSMLAYSRALLESQSEDNVTEGRKRSDLGSWSDLENMSEEFPGPPRDHFACAAFLSNPVVYVVDIL